MDERTAPPLDQPFSPPLRLRFAFVVENLLKYTGYGNAAGLLVARGLLAGGRGETQYSEDEDSDTEEYKSAKPLSVTLNLPVLIAPRAQTRALKCNCPSRSSINPITGHVEEPMPNPMEEMTEAQKEYEAEKLVTMIDKLSR